MRIQFNFNEKFNIEGIVEQSFSKTVGNNDGMMSMSTSYQTQLSLVLENDNVLYTFGDANLRILPGDIVRLYCDEDQHKSVAEANTKMLSDLAAGGEKPYRIPSVDVKALELLDGEGEVLHTYLGRMCHFGL